MVPNRSKAAERAARYREKLKQNQQQAKANDVASTGVQQRDGERDASRDGVTFHCDDLSVSSSLEETEKRSKKEVVARARGTRLPPDWRPNEALRQFARDHNVDPDTARAEFVDFWIAVPGQRGVKLDWDSTFRNRIRDLASGKFRSRAGPPQRQQQPSFRDLADQFGAFDETPATRPDETFDGPVIDGELDLSIAAGDIRAGFGGR